MRRLLYIILFVVLIYIVIMNSISGISDFNKFGPEVLQKCEIYKEGLDIYMNRGTKDLTNESKVKYYEWRNCTINAYTENHGKLNYCVVVIGDFIKQVFVNAF